ncbi:MAG: DUF3783 domain-containing protein [Thermodesulfobacteriota bacterium]
MSQGTFTRMGETDQPLYGPKALLVCGFTPPEQDAVMKLLAAVRLTDVPIIFAAATDGEEKLADLLRRTDQSGRNADSGLARAIIISGITESELHRTLAAYRQSGLPRPLWATLTPFSENWTLSALITELEQERTAMEQQQG